MAQQLKCMRKYFTIEEYKRIERVLTNNWEGILTIDEHIYARQYSFKDRREYMQDVSLNYQNRLSKIRIPTFALSAEDDFLCDPKCTPRQSVCGGKGSMLMSAETRAGSHCCHIANGLFRAFQWFPEPLLVFLDFIENKKQKF